MLSTVLWALRACSLKWGSLLLLVSCLAYSSTLKMEATCSSETSVYFQRTTGRYIPEDGTFHDHRCENLISYIFLYFPHLQLFREQTGTKKQKIFPNFDFLLTFFWFLTPCNLTEVYRYFGGTSCLHLQVELQAVKAITKTQAAYKCLHVAGFSLGFTIPCPED
jgi:hypothetical protein